MKNHHKISIILFIFIIVSLTFQGSVFAQNKLKLVSPEGNLAMTLAELEQVAGTKSDGKVKITGPALNTVLKTGDMVTANWKNTGAPDPDTTIFLFNEDIVFPVDMIVVGQDVNSHNFIITDEVPSGTYSLIIVGSISESTFDISKSFKIKTKLSKEKTEDLFKKEINNSQDKGSDAAAKAKLSNARAQAELYYDINGSYKDVCKKDLKDSGIKGHVSDARKATGKKGDCDSEAKAWAAEVKLKEKKAYFCVDSTGYMQEQKKSKGSKSTGCVKQIKINSNSDVDKATDSDVDKITAQDHFLSGSMKSKIKVLTYSDLECPYCKIFDVTIQNLIKEYGDNVAFVYRHFPLTQIHRNAEIAANASECVAKLGGEKKFPQYIHEVFKVSPDGLNSVILSELAVEQGVNKNSFDMCLSKYTYANEITKDIDSIGDTVKTNGSFGTPYSIVYDSKNKITPIYGSQSYNTVKDILDKLLK